MTTITEDYVSFETAKLLNEKGMNKSCFKHYVQKNNNDGTSEAVTVCTLQMAMKWLREVHNIVIVIDVCRETGREGFYCWQLEDNHTGDNIVNIVGECSTYEQACEASILYCLKNLI